MKPIEVGYVARVHGLAGELRITLHWAQSEALSPGRTIELRRGDTSRQARVVSVRAGGKSWIVRLEGVVERTQAEAWKGASVWVSREQLPPLEDGEYYLTDLVGAEVVGPAGRVGRVVEIAVHPSLDAAVIETPDGRRLEQPLMDHWIERVDLESNQLVLSTLEGLI